MFLQLVVKAIVTAMSQLRFRVRVMVRAWVHYSAVSFVVGRLVFVHTLCDSFPDNFPTGSRDNWLFLVSF